MYFIFKISEFILKNIPRKAGYFIFEKIALILFFFSKIKKHTLKKNICFVLNATDVPDKILAEIYKNYGRYYFDLFCKKEILLNAISDQNIFKATFNFISGLLENGHGLIGISTHIGNWDLGGSFLASLFPGRTNVVVEKLSSGAFRWFKETRERFGMKVIESNDIKSMLNALKHNEILVLLSDRDLDKNGLILDFFGNKAYIPSGPAKLALAHKSPIIFGGMLRQENPFYFIPAINTKKILNLEMLEKSQENVEKLSKEIIIEMEKIINQYPEQWCMLQKVWIKYD